MNPVQLVAVFAENKPGQTARVTGLLAGAGINLRWVSVASTGPFGVMKLLVNDSQQAHQVLKSQGLAVSFLDVLAVEVEDQPGGLHAVADCLARQQINLDNTSGFVTGRRAVLIVEAHDLPRAQAAIERAGLRVLSREDLLSL